MSKRIACMTGALALCLASLGPALAQDEAKEILELIDKLGGEQADLAVEGLVQAGQPAVKHLYAEAVEGQDMVRRGWAIVALAEIGGEQVRVELEKIYANGSQPKLVKTWAAAARIKLATSGGELAQLSNLASQLPAVGRPISLRIVDAEPDPAKRVEVMLQLTARHPNLQKTLTKAIFAQGAGPLAEAMLKGKDNQIRRQAAAYLATLGQRGESETIGALVAEMYAFDPRASAPSWEGGALFLPMLQPWPQAHAITLTKHLVAWRVWAERHNRKDINQQIINNLRSIGLNRVTGFQPGYNNFEQWLSNYGNAFGKAELEKLLITQGLNAKYRHILQRVNKP